MLRSTNPSKNYQLVGTVKTSTKAEIVRKVALARKAAPAWQAMSLKERIKLLHQVFAIFKQKQLAEELAQLASQEMGMPIAQAREDLMYSTEFLDGYLDMAPKYLSPITTYEDNTQIHQVYREPRGVAAVIIPWNFPFSNFVWQCAQNLIAGNTVVMKHSEEVPVFSQALERALAKTNLPKGVFNVVYGDGKIGKILVEQDIDLICFTGSTAVGQWLYQQAAAKFIPAVLEMGGSAPGIVCTDAKVKDIASTIFMNRFMNNGQICDGLKRLIVHKSKYKEVVAELKTLITEKKVGDAADGETYFGPLVAKRQLKVLEEQVADAVRKGAKVIVGGGRPKKLKGAYYLPTLLTHIKPSMRVWQEEVFGPMLPIVTFSTEEQAVKLANDTQYGLGSYVFTEDKKVFDRMAARLEAGMVSQNNLGYVRCYNPFGGYKKSGLGRVHGEYGFHDVTQVKVVAKDK